MPWVSVKFTARFAANSHGVPAFITQIDPDPNNPDYKLPNIKQYVPELESLVWDDTVGKKWFEGILGFNTDNYAAANIDWYTNQDDGDNDNEIVDIWDFTDAPPGSPTVQRAAWTIIRMITDRIFCVPAQIQSGALWSPVTGKYQLYADEKDEFGDGDGGGGAGGGGWGGMQSSP